MKRKHSMKKIILVATLLISVLTSVAYAGQQVTLSKKANFGPNTWHSSNTNDVTTIQYGGGDYYKNIYIQAYNSGAGAIVKNCGSIKHIDPGSVAICPINKDNPIVVFSSDKDDVTASGLYQIE